MKFKKLIAYIYKQQIWVATYKRLRQPTLYNLET